MKQEATLIRARLKTPRAAAIAGILFSVLLITGLLLFRLSVRADPLRRGRGLRPVQTESLWRSTWCHSQALPFYGSSACCATAWESLKTASLPPSLGVGEQRSRK